MACPSCGSDEWKLASLVYKGGLSAISATTTASGAVVGGSGIGFGTGQTTATSQSALSTAAAPPKASPIPGLLAVAVLFSLIIAYFSASSGWYGIALLFAAGLFFSYRREKRKNDSAMARYNVTRMCQRCGALYVP